MLYDDAPFSVSSQLLFVAPQRQFATITPFPGPGPLVPAAPAFSGVFSRDYVVPSVAAGVRLGDHTACAATYTQPFGAASDYSGFLAGSVPDGSVSQGFRTHEYGLTCALRMAAGPGRLHFLGGVFIEQFSFYQDQLIAPGVVAMTSATDNSALGYRLGLAYDIPQYGMRAELLYRSAVTHNAVGMVTGPGLAIPITVGNTLPQSIELKVQSGIAPGWFAFGSVKWADWSVLRSITVNSGLGPLRTFTLNYRDGWTVSAGIGHLFSERLIGTAVVSWDRGVGTGADIQTDTWTAGLGGSLRFDNGGEITAGASVSLLTAGSQSVFRGAGYNATVGTDLTYSVYLSGRVPF